VKQINTYLNFDGDCREAMTFYAKCLGAELDLIPFSQMPGDVPKEAQDRIIHARLHKGNMVLMASDSMPGSAVKRGNDAWIYVACESLDEIETLFPALAENGTVRMALHDAFWGARFGAVTDRFGSRWMLSFDLPK
jgi:PhnB protein